MDDLLEEIKYLCPVLSWEETDEIWIMEFLNSKETFEAETLVEMADQVKEHFFG